MKRVLLFIVLGLFLTGCGGPLTFNPPASLNYQNYPEIIPRTVGIYIPPEVQAKKFEQCEKLLFGSTQCYIADIGQVLETNAVAAYEKSFSKVVVLTSPTDFNGVDLAVQLAYASETLTTTLDGTTAYRTVDLVLEQKYLYPAALASAAPKTFNAQTQCKAWKCTIGGVEEGMDGSEVVLKQLFLPGFVFGGYGKALANVINTAFCASLKEALQDAVTDVKKTGTHT